MAGAEQLIGQAVGHSIQALRLGNLTEAQQDSLAAHVDAAPTSVFVDALQGPASGPEGPHREVEEVIMQISNLRPNLTEVGRFESHGRDPRDDHRNHH